MRRYPNAVALAGWTLFVWLTRIRNAWGDAELGAGQKWAATGLSLVFCGLAVAVLVALRRQLTTLWSVAVGALAALSVVVWVIRGTDIVLGDHSAPFKVVHAGLAVVSIALAVLAVGEVRATRTTAGSNRHTDVHAH